MKSKYSLFLCLLLLSVLVLSWATQIHTTQDEKQVSAEDVAHVDNDGTSEDRKYATGPPPGWGGFGGGGGGRSWKGGGGKGGGGKGGRN
ncbi:hypothetical protein IC582_016760 [Cucumis melo]